MYYLIGDPPPSIPTATPGKNSNKTLPLVADLLPRLNDAFLSPWHRFRRVLVAPLSAAFHYINNQRFCVPVKAGLAT